jgi:uncharacterized protein (DUF427 family)
MHNLVQIVKQRTSFQAPIPWDGHGSPTPVDPKEAAMKAIWNGAVLAESGDTIRLEGNHYFPPESVRREHLRDSNVHTTCPWKGQASYYDIVVDGEVNEAAAWYYPEPKDAAEQIRDRVAFWKGVEVVK